MNWLYYLLESNLYLIIFYLLYRVLFRRETYYQLNRIYLLTTTAVSFVIPLLQLGILRPTFHYAQNQEFTITQPQASPVQSAIQQASSTWSADNYYLLGYAVVAMLLLGALIFKIYKLVKLSQTKTAVKQADFKLIHLPGGNDAFSFFNYLFIGEDLALSAAVVQHEMVHIRQRHSWDILYFELLKIVNWFNPVIYLMQNSLKEVHEFIADDETIRSGQNTSIYVDFLVNNAYGIYSNTLTNTFFNKNLLKNRIMMLHQKKSGMAARLKFLVLLPLLAGLLCMSTLAFAKNYGWIDIAPKLAETNVQAPNNAPPLSGSKTIRHEIYPLHYTSKNLTELAIRLHNEGYKMTYDEFKEGNAKRLTISLRSLSTDTHSASATFKVDEMIKDADMIVVGANGEMPFVHSEKITFAKPHHLKDISEGNSVSKENARKIVKEQIDSINKSKVKKVNKQIDSAIKGEVKKTIKSQTDQQKISNAPPPPSGSYSGFNTLYTYLEKHIRYPAKYFENRIVDNVIAEFTVAADHKISACKIKNDAKPLFAEEVSRQLKAYTDTVNRTPGTYFFLIQFNLLSDKGTKSWHPSDKYLNLTSKANCAGNIEVFAYVKDE